MRHWKPKLWLVSFILLALLLGALGYIVFLWYSVDLIWVFFALLGIEFLIFIGVTCLIRRSFYLHLHHYTWAMCMIALLGVQNPFMAILIGWCNGVMIEGGARWGYDPIWKRHPDQCQ